MKLLSTISTYHNPPMLQTDRPTDRRHTIAIPSQCKNGNIGWVHLSNRKKYYNFSNPYFLIWTPLRTESD